MSDEAELIAFIKSLETLCVEQTMLLGGIVDGLICVLANTMVQASLGEYDPELSGTILRSLDACYQQQCDTQESATITIN